MVDVLNELRAKAAQCTSATPFVRVTGDMLKRAADEIADLRKALSLHETQREAILFERRAQE